MSSKLQTLQIALDLLAAMNHQQAISCYETTSYAGFVPTRGYSILIDGEAQFVPANTPEDLLRYAARQATERLAKDSVHGNEVVGGVNN